jgi:hypothetical protein
MCKLVLIAVGSESYAQEFGVVIIEKNYLILL